MKTSWLLFFFFNSLSMISCIEVFDGSLPSGEKSNARSWWSLWALGDRNLSWEMWKGKECARPGIEAIFFSLIVWINHFFYILHLCLYLKCFIVFCSFSLTKTNPQETKITSFLKLQNSMCLFKKMKSSRSECRI